jgi:hypothetical protein
MASFLHAVKKDGADQLLAGGSDGKFLFRSKGKSTDDFILSVVYKGNPTHHAVKVRAENEKSAISTTNLFIRMEDLRASTL